MRWWLLAPLAIVAFVSWLAASGLVSSNDGSHVALARALALRHETKIDDDVALTLYVDRAVRGAHDYSDRPPGTAFAAFPAVWLGDKLDPALRDPRGSKAAAKNFAETYDIRRRRHRARSPPLYGLRGTALALSIHTVVIGGLGLLAAFVLLRRARASPPAAAFAITTLGLATLWGPYSTALFSHVSAGTALAAMLVGATGDRRVHWVLGGAAAGWAIACEYTLLLAVVPAVLLLAERRTWPYVGLGSIPVLALVAAYHDAAFGSPLAIGYDFQSNFGFARDRATTFDANPLLGLWTLWGAGRGAGVLAQSPVVFAGLAGLWIAGKRRWLLALAPWALLLCFHRTPFGGGTEDHRYLVPALPILAVGIGLLWDRLATADPTKAPLRLATLIAAALASTLLTWTHFFSWRG